MAFQGAPFPARTEPIGADKLFTLPLLTWFRNIRQALDLTPTQIERVTLEAQAASIGTTPIPTDTLAAGLYRVTVSQRITVAAGVSSSLQTTISWTDGGVAQSFSGTALTANTTATTGSFTLLMHIDATTPISYATTYASNAAGAMEYRLDLVLEQVSLD